MKKIILALVALGVLGFAAESVEQERDRVMTQEKNMLMNKTGEQDGLKEMTQERKKLMIQEKEKERDMNQNPALYPNDQSDGAKRGKK